MAAAGLRSRWLGLVVVALGCALVPFATGSRLAEASSKDSLLALLRAGEVFCVGPTTLELHPDVGGEAAGVDLDFGDEEVVALSLHAPRPRRSLHEHHAHTGRHASPHVNVTLAMRCDIPPVPSAARGAREYAAAEDVSRGDDESVYAPIARDVKLVLGGEGTVEADDARRRRDILPRGSFHGQDSAHVGATSRCSPSARTDEACTGSSSHTRRSSRHPRCLRRLSTAARAGLLRPIASSTLNRSTAFCLRRPQARTIRFPQDWTMLVPMCTIPTLHPRRLPTLAATCAVQLAKSRTSSIAPITFSRYVRRRVGSRGPVVLDISGPSGTSSRSYLARESACRH